MRNPDKPRLLRAIPEGEAPEITAWHAQGHEVVVRIRQRLEDERQPIEIREAFAELMCEVVEFSRIKDRLAAANERYANLMQQFGLVDPDTVEAPAPSLAPAASGHSHDCDRDVCEPAPPCPSWCRECRPERDCLIANGAAFHTQLIGTMTAMGVELSDQRYRVIVLIEQFVSYENPSSSEPPTIQIRVRRDPEPAIDLAGLGELDDLSVRIMAAMTWSGRAESLEVSLGADQVDELFELMRRAREVLAEAQGQ